LTSCDGMREMTMSTINLKDFGFAWAKSGFTHLQFHLMYQQLSQPGA